MAKNYVGVVAVIAFGVSFVATAQPTGVVPNAAEVTTEQPRKPMFFRGSAMSYGLSASAYTFDASAEPYYNPTVVQRLGLMPEFHFGDQLFVRGRLFLSQELTQSDSTTYSHEIELSDLWLDVGASGWTEKTTGLNFRGDLRFTFPTSKLSQYQTKVLSLGPGVAVSRQFNVLAGLALSYVARFTYRWHKVTSPQTSGPTIGACGDPQSPACAMFMTSGGLNTNYDLAHGLSANFNPHPKVTLNGTFFFQHAWLYAPTPDPLVPDVGSQVRVYTTFNLSVTYQPWKPVGFSLGAYTFSQQPGLDGQYLFPLFNRNTMPYLEASFDIEEAAASLL